MPIARIKLPFSSVPVIPPPDPDGILTAGSLLLVDPTNPYQQWPGGVPANGGTVPNLAHVQAAALLGAGDATTLAAPVTRVGLTAGTGLVERTTLGGLHVIFSQTLNAATTDNYRIDYPSAIRTYLAANYDHALFLSLWWRVTRVQTALTYYSIIGNAGFTASSNYKQSVASDKVNPADAGTGFLGRRNAGSTLGDHQVNTGRSNHSGAAPANVAALLTAAFVVGNYSSQLNDTVAARGKSASAVLYRVYLEDLTVSGRTYAAVDAIDTAAYAAAFGVGGRYLNDTIPTAPATIP